jgi:predicted RecA/RadA family phage recombinase
MPNYNRPGTRYYASATKAVTHGAPVVENGVVGVAQKQKQPLSSVGIGGSPNPQVNIPIGEAFAIVNKGIVQVPYVGAAAKGTPVYITAASNALTLTGPGAPPTTYKYGVVVEVQTQRGTPTGFMRVDLDLKDSFV